MELVKEFFVVCAVSKFVSWGDKQLLVILSVTNSGRSRDRSGDSAAQSVSLLQGMPRGLADNWILLAQL